MTFIKIPKNVVIYTHPKKNFLLIKSDNNKVLIKSDLKIIKIKQNKTEFIYILNNQKTFYKENIARLKRTMIEVLFKSSKRLKLNGIGYKFIILSKSIIHLKLGFSHSVYFKLPEYVTARLNKNSVLFLFSNSTEKLSTIASAIKNCKIPDPYKGKGIMYVNEKVKLKLGKKL